ncbi:MAG: hypothetical protein IMZ50_16470 [Candidatus Atribacteria bacterium]|nr:hypothetical protein [Candidatus Atribacteria bacterium]
MSDQPEFPDDVMAFAAKNDLLDSLRLFRDQMAMAFADVRGMSYSVMSNPEGEDDQWIVVDVTVSGTVEEAHAQYWEAVKRIVADIPADDREMLRLAVNLDGGAEPQKEEK